MKVRRRYSGLSRKRDGRQAVPAMSIRVSSNAAVMRIGERTG